MLSRRALFRTGLLAGVAVAAASLTGGCAPARQWDDIPHEKVPRRNASIVERLRVSRAIKASMPDGLWADWSGRSETAMAIVETPLTTWLVADLLFHGANHSQRGIFGIGPDREAILLASNPGGLAEVMSGDGLTLPTVADAETFGRVALDVLRSFQTLSYQVDVAEDVSFHGVADPSAQERIRQVVRPLTAVSQRAGMKVTGFMINNQDLEEHTLTTASSGGLQHQVATVLTDLPTPIGR